MHEVKYHKNAPKNALKTYNLPTLLYFANLESSLRPIKFTLHRFLLKLQIKISTELRKIVVLYYKLEVF